VDADLDLELGRAAVEQLGAVELGVPGDTIDFRLEVLDFLVDEAAVVSPMVSEDVWIESSRMRIRMLLISFIEPSAT